MITTRKPNVPTCNMYGNKLLFWMDEAHSKEYCLRVETDEMAENHREYE